MADQIPDSTKMPHHTSISVEAAMEEMRAGHMQHWSGAIYDHLRNHAFLLEALATRAAPPAMDREAVYLQALEDVCNPLGYLQRMADAEGAKLSGMAYAIASDIGTIQRIARDALSTLSADAIRQGEGFKWPEPKFVPVESGAKLNPERVEAAFQLINGELVIGEQFQLIEMLLDGTDYTVAPATPASHASDGGKA